MDFQQQVLQYIRKNTLILPRGSVIVGVSGGADSMALLSALSGLRHHLGIELCAAHFNHRLRPEACVRMSVWSLKWCKKLNVPLKIGRRPG